MFGLFFCGGICVLSLVTMIVLLTTPQYYYFIIPLMSAIISYLLAYLSFCINTNKYPRNSLDEFFVSDFKKFVVKNGIQSTVTFNKIGGLWICDNGTSSIKLDLNGYLFQRAYIRSFVIRNLRYPIICRKRPMRHLFKNKYRIKNSMELQLILTSETKTVASTIVKNGISKYGLISKEITRAPFYRTYFLRKSALSFERNTAYIDERTLTRYGKRWKK